LRTVRSTQEEGILGRDSQRTFKKKNA